MFWIRNRRWNDLAIVASSAVIVLIAVPVVAHWRFGSLSQAVCAATNGWIWVRPDKLSLGSQSVGHAVPFAMSIVNRSGKRVSLLGVETSCTCIRTTIVGVRFPVEIDSGTEFEVPFAIEVSNPDAKVSQTVHFVIGLGAEQRRLQAKVEAGVRK